MTDERATVINANAQELLDRLHPVAYAIYGWARREDADQLAFEIADAHANGFSQGGPRKWEALIDRVLAGAVHESVIRVSEFRFAATVVLGIWMVQHGPNHIVDERTGAVLAQPDFLHPGSVPSTRPGLTLLVNPDPAT